MDVARRAWEAIDYRTPLVARGLGEAGVFATLAQGAKRTEEIAQECQLHEGALERALALLVGADVVEKGRDGRWSLTEVGMMLTPGHPCGAGDMAVFLPWELEGWSRLDHSLATGECAFETVTGMPLFEWFGTNPEAGRRLDRFMQQRTRGLLERSVPLYDGWPDEGVVVDVGGGNGTLLAFLMASRPRLQGVLLDRPEVVAGAADVLAGAGISERVEVVAGDFFHSIPSGGDLYVLASVLHDWNDVLAAQILENVRSACARASRVLLFEAVLRPPGEHDPMRITDMHMLVMAGGRERGDDEWRDLLTAGGFATSRIVHGQPLSWIEAVPS